jgi:hypothetical protein
VATLAQICRGQRALRRPDLPLSALVAYRVTTGTARR